MTIGTGIALLGVWGFAACCALSSRVTGIGMALAMMVAIIATAIVAH
jgi:hypothetical protein